MYLELEKVMNLQTVIEKKVFFLDICNVLPMIINIIIFIINSIVYYFGL